MSWESIEQWCSSASPAVESLANEMDTGHRRDYLNLQSDIMHPSFQRWVE